MHHKNETEIHKVNDRRSDDYIPTMSCLLRWQSELQNTLVAIGKFYCQFWLAGEQCRYDLEAIFIAQKLHKAREIKEAVEKELTYLFSPCMKPVSITKDIDYNALEKFIEIIHDTPYLSKLSSFDKLPEELARLCGRRYLSDEHVSWVIQKLNSMQSDILCIYGNFVTDIERFCERQVESGQYKKLLFIFNVGYTKTTGQNSTFIAENGLTGCHFSICVYDKELKTAIYGDSLGWPAPGKLIQKIYHYVKEFFGEPENILLRECHNSNSNRQESHVCKNDCCVVYPLQKDGDICGIVCIVVASIVCLAPRFWKYILITKPLDRKGNPCQYLHEPTKFHRYLRTIVTWFSNENIDIEMIINNRWILGDINESKSSSDKESR